MAAITRREFTKAAALAGVTAAVSASSAQSKPSERIRLGFIGVGNRGDQVLGAFLTHKDAEVVAICDLYQPHLDLAARKIGTQPARFTSKTNGPRASAARQIRSRPKVSTGMPGSGPRHPGRTT